MFSAPLGRSLQPMASTTARASMANSPSCRLRAVTATLASPGPAQGIADSSATMVSRLQGIPRAFAFSTYLAAYSGPVSSSPKVCSPKPL